MDSNELRSAARDSQKLERNSPATGDTWLNRQKWLRDRVHELPRPLAFFSPEADSLTEFAEACTAESIAIPDEVGTLGLHDSPLFRNCSGIPLSCITVDYELQTRLCCEMLIRMMEGETGPFEDIMIPPTGIITRRSSDTLAAQTPVVAKAIRYMLDHYAASIEVADIVRVSGLSRPGLYKAFQADIGQSPHAVLTRIRMDKAKRMLRETDEKIRTVAELCGFGDSVNLYRQFKTLLDTTPGGYRKNMIRSTSNTC